MTLPDDDWLTEVKRNKPITEIKKFIKNYGPNNSELHVSIFSE